MLAHSLDRYAYSVREAMEMTGLSTRQVALALRVDERSVWRWKAGGPVVRTRRPAILGLFSALGVELILSVHQERPMGEVTPFPGAEAPPSEESVTMQQSSRIFLDEDTLSHFRLTADPFDDLTDDPTTIWMTPEHRRTESAMELASRRHAILAIAGDPGSGKSTRLRRFFARTAVGKTGVRIIAPASIDRSRITGTALAVAIIRDLIDTDTSSWQMEKRSELLRRTLAEMGAQGIHPVMLIDEAHLLTNRALLAIKQVWDSHTMWKQLGVVLVGQLPLSRRLRTDPEIKEVTGRTTILEVPKMTPDDVRDYVRWRMAKAGREADELVHPSVWKLLAVQGEYPMGVNNLLSRMLVYAGSVGDDQLVVEHLGRG